MSKRIFYIIISFCLVILVSCKTSTTSTKESPLAVVIKLVSAEELSDFEAAKKYLDVEKAYHAMDTVSAENMWKAKVNFANAIGNDKKFTNIFKYYEYNIREKVINDKAEVMFEAIDPEATVHKIVYHLSSVNKEWIVFKIEYITT